MEVSQEGRLPRFGDHLVLGRPLLGVFPGIRQGKGY
jgi:hypothetical protein